MFDATDTDGSFSLHRPNQDMIRVRSDSLSRIITKTTIVIGRSALAVILRLTQKCDTRSYIADAF
jgi:hypothetical protein